MVWTGVDASGSGAVQGATPAPPKPSCADEISLALGMADNLCGEVQALVARMIGPRPCSSKTCEPTREPGELYDLAARARELKASVVSAMQSLGDLRVEMTTWTALEKESR